MKKVVRQKYDSFSKNTAKSSERESRYDSPFFASAAGLAPKRALRSVSVLVWSYIFVSIFRSLCPSRRATM